MRRIMLDTDALDLIATSGDYHEALKQAIGDGQIEVWITHVQFDQCIVMADKQPTEAMRDKRGRLLNLMLDLPVRLAPTAGFIVGGLSRVGLAKIDDGLSDEVASGPPFAQNVNNRADVLLVHTAADIGAEFVSVDRRARAYAAGRGLIASDPGELLASLSA